MSKGSNQLKVTIWQTTRRGKTTSKDDPGSVGHLKIKFLLLELPSKVKIIFLQSLKVIYRLQFIVHYFLPESQKQASTSMPSS